MALMPWRQDTSLLVIPCKPYPTLDWCTNLHVTSCCITGNFVNCAILRKFAKWNRPDHNLWVGDLMCLRDEGTFPTKWPLFSTCRYSWSWPRWPSPSDHGENVQRHVQKTDDKGCTCFAFWLSRGLTYFHSVLVSFKPTGFGQRYVLFWLVCGGMLTPLIIIHFWL